MRDVGHQSQLPTVAPNLLEQAQKVAGVTIACEPVGPI